MREKVDQFGGLAAVRDEEQDVVLDSVVSMLCRESEKDEPTSRMSPRSPWAASAACMKLAAMLKLFSVATVFLPTRPLLPTPQTITFPPSAWDLVMHSTAPRSPSLACGSVWYNLVT